MTTILEKIEALKTEALETEASVTKDKAALAENTKTIMALTKESNRLKSTVTEIDKLKVTNAELTRIIDDYKNREKETNSLVEDGKRYQRLKIKIAQNDF